MQPNKDGFYVVRTQYACGAEIGFVTKDPEVAGRKAAEIMTSECPECKMKKGIKLTYEEEQILLAGFENALQHEAAKKN